MSFGARALIRLGALGHNLQRIRKQARGARVMAVIKANAYGHGLLPVAAALEQADSLTIARLSEASCLRDAGIGKPLVLLAGVLSADDLPLAAELGVELGVHTPVQIDWLETTGQRGFVVWLKVDTGMRRLGFMPDDVAAALDRLRRCNAVSEVRLMTHLACAEDPDTAATPRQLERFRSVIAGFDGAVSVANSPALFGWSDEIGAALAGHTDVWIRPGLALYGISPFADGSGADFGLKPVMQFETHLIAVKPIREGDRVGYGGTWRAERDTTLGIIAAGYGDGYSRYIPSGTPVLINDRRVPLAGVVSMDMSAVDLGADADDRLGDVAILWGDALPVEEVARCAGTIPYQLVCGVTHREAAEVID